MTTNYYDKFGGEETVAKVVEYFYTLVLQDDSISHFFSKTDMEKQRMHQTKFISFALGGPNQYAGASMAKAHAGLNLQLEHFAAVATHLSAALAHFGVEQSDIDDILSRIAPLSKDILHK